MEHVRWLAEPTLHEPGRSSPPSRAGTTRATLHRRRCAPSSSRARRPALAEIDPEPYTDFATVRPHVRLTDSANREIVWPTVGVWSASLPGTDVDPRPRPRAGAALAIVLRADHRARRAPRGTDWRSRSARCSPTCRTRRPVHLIGTATDQDADRTLRAGALALRRPDGDRRSAAGGVHPRRHPVRVAVGRGARLRRRSCRRRRRRSHSSSGRVR